MQAQRLLILFSFLTYVLTQTTTTAEGATDVIGYFTQETQTEAGQGQTWLRMAHGKPHGCVQATVNINSALPSQYQQGIFVPGASYPAFIRFSNGVGRGFTPLLNANESDAVPDIRGFGLKIFNCAKGWPNTPSVDFQFTTSRVGFLPDIPSAVSFFSAVYSGNLATTAWLATNPRLATLFAAQGIDGNVDNLLTADWWTPVVSRFGPTYFKSHLYPCGSSPKAAEDAAEGLDREAKSRFFKSFNYYTDLLVQDLGSASSCFTWAIQFWQSNSTTPIDDTTIQWNTPFTPVASITIPKQTFMSPGQQTYCDYMSFNPALNIPAHAPVGVLQELRSAVYTAMPPVRRAALGLNPKGVTTCTDYNNYPHM